MLELLEKKNLSNMNYRTIIYWIFFNQQTILTPSVSNFLTRSFTFLSTQFISLHSFISIFFKLLHLKDLRSIKILSLSFGQLMISKVWMKDFDIFYFNKELKSCEDKDIFLSLITFMVGEIERSFFWSYSRELTSMVNFFEGYLVIIVEQVKVFEATEEQVIERSLRMDSARLVDWVMGMLKHLLSINLGNESIEHNESSRQGAVFILSTWCLLKKLTFGSWMTTG